MTVAETAQQVGHVLSDEYPDSVLAVGWYDERHPDLVDVTYLAGDLADDPVHEMLILENALQERTDRARNEMLHDEPLAATIRLYDTRTDIDIPVSPTAGILLIVERSPSTDYDDLIDLTATVANVELGTGHSKTTAAH